jgi:hypothetical protein
VGLLFLFWAGCWDRSEWELGKGVRVCGLTLLQNETDPLLAQVFVYDFVNQANLGW